MYTPDPVWEIKKSLGEGVVLELGNKGNIDIMVVNFRMEVVFQATSNMSKPCLWLKVAHLRTWWSISLA